MTDQTPDIATPTASWPWDVLGVAPGSERLEIKRAYARLVRHARPEDDALAFHRLRAAYEAALTLSERGLQVDFDPVEPTASVDPPMAPGPNAALYAAHALAPADADDFRLDELVTTLLDACQPMKGDEDEARKAAGRLVSELSLAQRSIAEATIAGVVIRGCPLSALEFAAAAHALGWDDVVYLNGPSAPPELFDPRFRERLDWALRQATPARPPPDPPRFVDRVALFAFSLGLAAIVNRLVGYFWLEDRETLVQWRVLVWSWVIGAISIPILAMVRRRWQKRPS